MSSESQVSRSAAPGEVAAPSGEDRGRGERLLWVLSAATFLIFFQAFMVAPILPRLAELFRVPVGTIGLIVPAYLIPYGAATLVYGPPSDRFGRGGSSSPPCSPSLSSPPSPLPPGRRRACSCCGY